MQYIKTSIPDLWIIEPKVFGDHRGYFFEAWREDEFQQHVGPVHFVQDNESKSTKGVLRGMHLQRGDFAQAKLVRVLSGRVLDVAVDIRPDSPTYKQYFMTELSSENHRQMFIPRGFAHGFLVLSDEAVFTYKVDNFYAPQAEAGFRWDDPEIAIEWPTLDVPFCLSEKDQKAPAFSELKY